MLKSILAVIVGYVVMAIFAFGVFTAAYFCLGADRAFEPASYTVSTLWIAVMIVITLIAGIIGGFVCAAISKSKTTCLVFAGIVFLLSLVFAIPHIMKERTDTVRSGDVSNIEAMQQAQPPTWVCLVNPVLGAAGILLGARMKKPVA